MLIDYEFLIYTNKDNLKFLFKRAEFRQPRINSSSESHDNPVTPTSSENPTTPTQDNNKSSNLHKMDYRFEEFRLQSFTNWNCPFVQPADLAAAGFYYTGYIDQVQCFECSICICRWEEGDVPQAMHEEWGGRCRFKRKVPCGNVPIGVDPNTIPESQSRGRDIGPSQSKMKTGTDIPPINPQQKEEKREPLLPEKLQTNDLGICKVCYDRELGMLFIPCGHMACIKCAPDLKNCAMCRSPIQTTIRAYLS